MKHADPFKDSADSRIIRRPSQPRSNMERFTRCDTLASQLREAMQMGSAGRHRVYDALMGEVLDLFEELAGDSLVKLQMPKTDLFQENGGGEDRDDPITLSAANGRG